MIAVDTSVLVDFFRGVESSAVELFVSLERDAIPFAVPAICCQELLQGARNKKEWKLLSDYLGTQRLLAPEDPWVAHSGAARIYFESRRKGVTVRSAVDCLVAEIALEEEATLLHDDEEFERIKRVRPLRTLRG